MGSKAPLLGQFDEGSRYLRNDRSGASPEILPSLCFSSPEYRAPIEIMTKYPKALTLIFLIFTTSTVLALQALSLPPNPAPSGLPTIVAVPGWTYRGCYTDRVDSRTLTAKKWTGSLTPRRCASICRGYRYFALESSNE